MMRRMNLPFNRLTHIFISHLHGDHCLGLPGLISTMSLHEKGDNLTVVLPAEGIDMMRRMTEFSVATHLSTLISFPPRPESWQISRASLSRLSRSITACLLSVIFSVRN